MYGGHVGDAHDLRQLLLMPVVAKGVLQPYGSVEMVLYRPLPSAGDYQDVVDAGGHRLLDHILDGGLVYDREHLFRLILGHR